MSRPDPKPSRRLVDRSAWRLVLTPSSRCIACGAGDRLEAHHLVPRSRGGDDVTDNLVPLCYQCHGHLHRSVSAGLVVRRLIAAGLAPANVAYITGRMGPGWLEARYPSGPAC